jgi:hypothetical protein
MSNIVEWVELAAGMEPIIACVIGDYGWGLRHEKNSLTRDVKGKVLSWEEAIRYLDYEFDDGYGSVSCHAIYAWTENLIIFISKYDGSTYCHAIPRNPVACEPYMPGG